MGKIQDWVSTSQHDFMSGAERQVDRVGILETFTLRRPFDFVDRQKSEP